MEASSGIARVFSRPAREMRSQTGYLTQTFSLYPDLTVAENIRYSGDLRRIPRLRLLNAAANIFECLIWTDSRIGSLEIERGNETKNWPSFPRSCRNPEFCCSMSQLPASILYPVVSFGTVLAHLTAEGLTILVATPLLGRSRAVPSHRAHVPG